MLMFSGHPSVEKVSFMAGFWEEEQEYVKMVMDIKKEIAFIIVVFKLQTSLNKTKLIKPYYTQKGGKIAYLSAFM